MAEKLTAIQVKDSLLNTAKKILTELDTPIDFAQDELASVNALNHINVIHSYAITLHEELETIQVEARKILDAPVDLASSAARFVVLFISIFFIIVGARRMHDWINQTKLSNEVFPTLENIDFQLLGSTISYELLPALVAELIVASTINANSELDEEKYKKILDDIKDKVDKIAEVINLKQFNEA